MNAKSVLGTIGHMFMVPFKVRRHPPTPPTAREHYEPTPLAATVEAATMKAAEVPVAKTPPGGYREWPEPVLTGCDEPLVDGAPDLRGVWQVHKGPLRATSSGWSRPATGW